MKMYLVAIVIAFIGLWVSSEVRADGLCGIRSSGVFSVESFEVQDAADDELDYVVTLRSLDDKAIKSVGGRVEFFLGGNKSIAQFEIRLEQPVDADGTRFLSFGAPRTAATAKLVGAHKGQVQVLACVDSIDYMDGSGTIIN
jgi:hypothetical protein